MKLLFAVSQASFIFQKRLSYAVSKQKKVKYSFHTIHKVTYSNNKAKNDNLTNTKKMTTEIILRCTPCNREQCARMILIVLNLKYMQFNERQIFFLN